MRVHGVHGAVKIMPETDNVNRFKKCKTVFIEDKNSYFSYNVESVQLLNNAAALKLETIDTVEEAQFLVGKFLCVKREDAVKLPANKYFIEDLIGCTVLDTDNHIIGKITDVLTYSANDVIIIDNGKIAVPFLIKLIASVSIEDKTVVFQADVFLEVACYAD